MNRFRILAATLFAALLSLPVAAAQARVPAGFVGADVNGPLLTLSAPRLSHEFDVMAQSGVETVRADFFWAVAQPYPSFAQVPPAQLGRFENVNGVPTDFSASDRIVQLASARGMTILPTVSVAPAWAAEQPGDMASPPSNDAAFASFVAALARRYGPSGTFWGTSSAADPIRSWEIWNEPNSWAAQYAQLLRVTRPALKQVDPGAQMVLGSLTNTASSVSWKALQTIYSAGGAGQFDAVAINPYTADIQRVILVGQLIRQVMARNGDSRLPLEITEMSWPSSKGRTSWQPDWSVTQAQQAQRVTAAYRALAAQRTALKLESAYWYTWLTSDNAKVDAFGYSGLRRVDANGNVVAKPAYFAFRSVALSLEGCRSKGSTATDCLR